MIESAHNRGSPRGSTWEGYTSHEDAFVGYLEGLIEDRGALAALRRGLGKPPGTAVEMHRYVLPRLPADLPPWEEDAYYLVAALFASHPGRGEVGNMGDTFRRMVDPAAGDSIERRFVALLKCHPEDLDKHLRQAVSLAKAKEVPVNYRRLLHDIKLWGHPDGIVQRQWAEEFWAGRAASSEKAEPEPQGPEP